MPALTPGEHGRLARTRIGASRNRRNEMANNT